MVNQTSLFGEEPAKKKRGRPQGSRTAKPEPKPEVFAKPTWRAPEGWQHLWQAAELVITEDPEASLQLPRDLSQAVVYLRGLLEAGQIATMELSKCGRYVRRVIPEQERLGTSPSVVMRRPEGVSQGDFDRYLDGDVD